MSNATFRQGDVLILRVKDEGKMKRGAKAKREGRKLVLAYGEVTGHMHAIAETNAFLYPLMEENGNASSDRLLEVLDKPVMLRHDEHAEIELEPGCYVVRIQREFSNGYIQNVMD